MHPGSNAYFQIVFQQGRISWSILEDASSVNPYLDYDMTKNILVNFWFHIMSYFKFLVPHLVCICIQRNYSLLDFPTQIVYVFSEVYDTFTSMFCLNALGKHSVCSSIFKYTSRTTLNVATHFIFITIMTVHMNIQRNWSLTWRSTTSYFNQKEKDMIVCLSTLVLGYDALISFVQ